MPASLQHSLAAVMRAAEHAPVRTTPSNNLSQPGGAQACSYEENAFRRPTSAGSAWRREEQHRGRAAGSSRADAEHRLVARERELRALAAEKDVLAQQARAAWALLDERSAAAHELEAVKQQQLDENNRLRATLEEWSHRNARC